MHLVTFNRCLNKEKKHYGFSELGLIGGGVIGCCVWLKFGMTVGIGAMAIGYGFSSYWARKWHDGILQRSIYWNLPLRDIFGGNYLPESYKRSWM